MAKLINVEDVFAICVLKVESNQIKVKWRSFELMRLRRTITRSIRMVLGKTIIKIMHNSVAIAPTTQLLIEFYAILLNFPLHFHLHIHRIHGRHSMKGINRLHSAYTIRVQYCQSSKQQRLHSSNAIRQPYHPMWHYSMNSIRPVHCSPFTRRRPCSRPTIRSTQPPKFRPSQAMATDCYSKISRQNPYSSS